MRRKSRKHDPDVAAMSLAKLRNELMKFRRETRRIRDTSDNARCWMNVERLCALLPEYTPENYMRLPEGILLANCKRYIRQEKRRLKKDASPR